jgi:hypothetical protein
MDALVNALTATLKLPSGEQRSAILTTAARAIAAFCTNAASATAFVSSGGLGQLLKGALTDLENEDLMETAMEVACLCAKDLANVSRMVQDGAVEDIVAMMKAFPFNEKIQLQGLKSLAALCSNAEGARRFMANGGADVLIEALRNALEDPVAAKLAVDLITALAQDDESVAKLLSAGAIDAILAGMFRDARMHALALARASRGGNWR